MKESQKNKMVKEDDLDKLATLEQKMRAFKGTSLHGHIKATKICLVPNVIILKTFRVSKFIKYIGTQCPVTHVKAYYTKMAKVVNDEKLLIHFL